MKRLISLLTIAEWIAAWLAQLAFWHVSPPIRDRWVWLLILPLIFWGVRLILTRRWQVSWGWVILFGAFLALTAFNFVSAPYHRQDYWVLVCRPLGGMWLVVATVFLVQQFQTLRWVVVVMSGLALVVGLLGLTASQWDKKSDIFSDVMAVLPQLDAKQVLPDAQLSFNPNEIAGALAWLCPLAFGFGVWAGAGRLRWLCYGIGALLLAALFIGQSRSALFGVLGVLALMPLLLARGRLRWALLGVVIVMIGAEVLLMRAVPESASPTATDTSAFALSGRDLSSVNTRFQMWQRSLEMLRDYPLTGIGMAMYRAAIRTPQYQIPYFEKINFTAPHTHNEWLQIAVDLGLPGLIWYAALYGWVIRCLWQIRRADKRALGIMAVSIAAALAAHAFYGLGDAITFWDRFALVGWAVLALLAGTHEQHKIRYNNR